MPPPFSPFPFSFPCVPPRPAAHDLLIFWHRFQVVNKQAKGKAKNYDDEDEAHLAKQKADKAKDAAYAAEVRKWRGEDGPKHAAKCIPDPRTRTAAFFRVCLSDRSFYAPNLLSSHPPLPVAAQEEEEVRAGMAAVMKYSTLQFVNSISFMVYSSGQTDSTEGAFSGAPKEGSGEGGVG